jgi:hypothetical protein
VQPNGLDAEEVLPGGCGCRDGEVVLSVGERRGPAPGVGANGGIDDALLRDLVVGFCEQGESAVAAIALRAAYLCPCKTSDSRRGCVVDLG